MKISAAKRFWNWFQRNNTSYMSVANISKKEKRHLVDELCVHLKDYAYRGVYVDILYDKIHAQGSLIFTANGNRRHFDKIEKLVEKAPAIENWTFYALYPSMPAAYQIAHIYPGLEIDPDDIYFSPLQLQPNQGSYDLTFYIPEDVELSEAYLRAVEDIVYNLLGERSAVMDIYFIDVFYVQEASIEIQESLRNINELPAFIQSTTFSAFNVTQQGAIVPR
jgi:hypothetical protein